MPAEIEMDEPELDPKQRADSMKDADDDCLPRWLLNNVDVELETQLCVYPKREYAEPRGLEPNCDGDASLAPKIRTDVDLPLPSQLETLEDEGEGGARADQEIARKMGGIEYHENATLSSKQSNHMTGTVSSHISTGRVASKSSHDTSTSQIKGDTVLLSRESPGGHANDRSAACFDSTGIVQGSGCENGDGRLQLPRLSGHPGARSGLSKVADSSLRRTAKFAPRAI